MLDLGANNYGWAMTRAARRGHENIVRLMLSQGLNHLQRFNGSNGLSALL